MIKWKYDIGEEVILKDKYGTEEDREHTWRVTKRTTRTYDDEIVPAYSLVAVDNPVMFTGFTEKALKRPGYSVNTDFRVTPREEIVTDPVTGGQKGKKPLQVGAIDPLARAELGKVAAFGGDKYDRGNYLKGYDWSLSVDALHRHLLAFESGEDYDDESGLLHVVHAAWHCLALASFKLRDLGTDDRFEGK